MWLVKEQGRSRLWPKQKASAWRSVGALGSLDPSPVEVFAMLSQPSGLR